MAREFDSTSPTPFILFQYEPLKTCSLLLPHTHSATLRSSSLSKLRSQTPTPSFLLRSQHTAYHLDYSTAAKRGNRYNGTNFALPHRDYTFSDRSSLSLSLTHTLSPTLAHTHSLLSLSLSLSLHTHTHTHTHTYTHTHTHTHTTNKEAA
jgi:hypothetical protein